MFTFLSATPVLLYGSREPRLIGSIGNRIEVNGFNSTQFQPLPFILSFRTGNSLNQSLGFL